MKKLLFGALTLLALNPAISNAEPLQLWQDLGPLSALPATPGGAIFESCQYRLTSLLSRLDITANHARPGKIYFDFVSVERTSINFGESVLSEPVDYPLTVDLRAIDAFTSSRIGDAALSVLKDTRNRILSVKLIVAQAWNFGITSTPGAKIFIEIQYMPGTKSPVTAHYLLNPADFELETNCPIV